MIPSKLVDCLANNTGSYILPFIWYTGESKELIKKEIYAVKNSGAKEFVFENRGGDYFGTDFWWDIFKFVLDTAKALNMRVWSLDDSHVNTGSANDSLSKDENAKFRATNLRIELMDIVGPIAAAAISLPRKTPVEEILKITAFKLNETTGKTYGEGIDLTNNIKDGLCLIDYLDNNLYRVYFIIKADLEKCGVFKNYISMVSKESCGHLITEVHEKFYSHFASYFGNTFAGFFSDEPAFGNCDGQYGPYAYELKPGQPDKMFPWNDNFPKLLANELSVSEEEVWNILPSLWDDMEAVSPKFRLAYMNLITNLWKENFSEQIGNWCKKHQIEYIGHNLEDDGAHMRSGWGCGHYFRSLSGQSMSGMDLVFDQLTPGISQFPHASNSRSSKRQSAFYHYTLPKLAASLAHHNKNMHNRALSEVLGATGWTCGADYMHAIFNTCQVCGINYFIPHAFSMSLPDVFEKQQEKVAKSTSYTPPGYCLRYLAPTFYTGGYNPQFEVFKEIISCAQRVSHILSDTIHCPDFAVYYNAEGDWMNCSNIQNLDNVTMNLTRNGFDFDIVSQDMLNEITIKDNKLIIDHESYKALIVPSSNIMPNNLLATFNNLIANGVPVYFVGPKIAESECSILTDEFNFNSIKIEELLIQLKENFSFQVPIKTWDDNFRYYPAIDSNNNKLYLLYNSNRNSKDITLLDDGVIYNPWSNTLYKYNKNNSILLNGFQLLIYYPNCNSLDKLDCYPAIPDKWSTLKLKYDIFFKAAGKEDYQLLRNNSDSVNLLRIENLTRTCGEFCYESKFEVTNNNYTFIKIPHSSDATLLILNGQSCDFALGPNALFNISGKLKSGTNTIVIKTFDTPSYVDRKGCDHIGYGAAFPLRAHGFTGDIQIG